MSAGRALSVVRTGSTVIAVAALAGTGGLLLWAVLPVGLGAGVHVVVGASMEPHVAVGDVLVSRPLPADGARKGAVLTFREPDDVRRVVTHRVVSVAADGSYTTRGDANPTDDAWRVAPQDVLGVAVLRVPYVGLPAWWARTGQWVPFGAFAAAVSTAAVLAGRDGMPGELPGGLDARHARPQDG